MSSGSLKFGRLSSMPFVLAAVLGALLAGVARVRAEEPLPRELAGIGIEERLGQQVPLDIPLTDHNGKAVKLGDYLKAGRPVIVTLNYYSCATLCSFVLNGLMTGLRGVDFTIGKDIQVVTVSIDPKEGPALAAAKRKSYLEGLGKPVAHSPEDEGWPFLTGKEPDLKRLGDSLGFHYRYDVESKQFAHAAGIFVLTPQGRISRVLFGLDFPPRDLRLALVEAGKGSIGSPVDQLLLLCYHYDPKVGRYGITPMGVMRLGGILTVAILGAFLLVMWRRERRAAVVHD